MPVEFTAFFTSSIRHSIAFYMYDISPNYRYWYSSFSVAEKLRLNLPVEAEKFSMVTVLVSDIVGFTSLCSDERVVPMDIVRLLNKLYTQFDLLSSIHGVQKLESE